MAHDSAFRRKVFRRKAAQNNMHKNTPHKPLSCFGSRVVYEGVCL